MKRILTLTGLTLILSFSPVFAASHFLVISCSLSKTSHSALLAEQAVKDLKAQGQDVDYIDLRNYKLPHADGHEGSAYDNRQVKEIHDRIEKADGILIASPIYLNSVASVTKNLVELTAHPHKGVLRGRVWQGKVVGFLGASGGTSSTYSFFPLLTSLIVDSKVVVVPTFAMASSKDFNDKNQMSEETLKRVDDTTKELVRITSALKR